MTDHAATLEWLGTGSAALDAILGGGIPAQSVTVVAGEPGSGKTVFTLQALFHHARQGKKCLYFTTLSEPALKVIRYMQLFSFFDARLIEDRITFVDLGSALRRDGAEKTLVQMLERVESFDQKVGLDSAKSAFKNIKCRYLVPGMRLSWFNSGGKLLASMLLIVDTRVVRN